MANFFKKLLDTLNVFTEEDDLDDEYDGYLQDQEEKGHKRLEKDPLGGYTKPKPEKKSQPASIPVSSNRSTIKDDYEYSSSSYPNDAKKDRIGKTERLGSGKVVPIRTTSKGFEVCVIKPSGFNESKDICDVILSGRACVINLEGFDVELAQRVMDFVSGSLYAVDGRLHQISNYIFIVSPESVDVSGDYFDIIGDNFGAPTLNKGL